MAITDNSNHNSYHYKRGDIIQIPSLRLLKGALVIKKRILAR